MSAADVISGLAAVAGAGAVTTDAAEREFYASDALGAQRAASAGPSALPLAVVAPGSVEEVAAVVRFARGRGLGISTYGGGTGLMGGARAVDGGIVLNMGRMNRVREIDVHDRVAWVEAGCVLADLDAALKPHGLMAGHDPWTFGVATVGGAISTNGLGFLGGRYGSMGQQMLAVEAVMADGTVIRTRAVQPRSAGLDLSRLFVGAEGAFGVVTAAALRVFAIPEARELRGWRFASFDAGFAALGAMYRRGLTPTVLDYGEHPDGDDDDAATTTLYLGFDGLREEVAALMGRASDECASHGGAPIHDEEVRAFWETRHVIAEDFARRRAEHRAPRRAGRADRAFDYVHVSLPVSRVLEYRQKALAIAREGGMHVVEAGLWVTPGLFSLVVASASSGETVAASVAEVVEGCLRLAQDLGGSMEYCHGVGVRLAHLMEREHDASIEIMRAIKDAVDPAGVLNAGKFGL